MNMAVSESHIDPLAVYAAHSFADDRAYQVSRLLREQCFTADSSKAGLSSLYPTSTLAELSGEAREGFLRRSRVFYFNQWALLDLFNPYIRKGDVPQSSRV